MRITKEEAVKRAMDIVDKWNFGIGGDPIVIDGRLFELDRDASKNDMIIYTCDGKKCSHKLKSIYVLKGNMRYALGKDDKEFVQMVIKYYPELFL